ncbi:FkbM family methyltransferase [Shimia isoporae]|uniref:FkbM family methyltransferase n=1 Tax=Shimia isoporae TaxID=647720 RepID=A0A4R1N9W0_9RHOB|nr:FkbM family methyltransferase [Shimia isoporae]TCL00602.1 FkbM family methyltransferase [Shimia isoporae]
MAAESDIDIHLLNHYFAQRPNGRTHVLVEIGAASPEYLSIGAGFRKAGWRVLSVEPNPIFAEQHRRMGHEIYEFAASDSDADEVDFYLVNLHGIEYQSGEITYESISSLGIRPEFQVQLDDLSDKASVERIKVRQRRLDTILATAAVEVAHIDLLCIDVEGWEMEVLGGLDFEKLAPSVIVLENFGNSSIYRDRIGALGYVLIEKFPPNEIFVRRYGEGQSDI